MNRVTGRVSADGTAYELVQAGQVLKSTPIETAKADPKHKAAIARNKWEPLP